MSYCRLKHVRSGCAGRACLLTAAAVILCCAVPVSAAVVVDTVTELVEAVNRTATGGDRTVLVRDGTYLLHGQYLRITADGVILRSESGNRDSVVLDGGYETTEIVQIVASGVILADLTLKRAADHPVHVMGSSSGDIFNTLLDNLHIIDAGEQAVKINPAGGHGAHAGIIRNCLIELTDAGRIYVENDTGNGYPCYTGGIDGHQARGWIIQDNEITGFWCSTGLSEHGIHFWNNSQGTLVERNLIVDCDRGIGFGLGASGHKGGIIRNNMISRTENHGHSDVGIGLESAFGVRVYNNTVFLGAGYPNGIEYRFPASKGLVIMNNLTNRQIVSRGGGDATLSTNITSAAESWFVDAAAGNLHLRSARSGVTDAAATIHDLLDDFDRQSRPIGNRSDIGADEYSREVPDKRPPAPSRKTFVAGWLILLQGRTP